MSVPMKWVLSAFICFVFSAYTKYDKRRTQAKGMKFSEDVEMVGDLVGALFGLAGWTLLIVAAFKAVWQA